MAVILMLTIIHGKDRLTIRETMLKNIRETVLQAEENQRQKWIYLVPESMSHAAQRRLCSVLGDRCSRYAEVLTFSQMARRVSQEYGGGVECLDAGGRILAMAAAAMQLPQELKIYHSVYNIPETLTDLVEMADELKRYRIHSSDLALANEMIQNKIGESAGSLKQKMDELTHLMGFYDGICENGKHDPRTREEILIEQLTAYTTFAGFAFCVEGFITFDRQQLAILECIMEDHDVMIGACYDDLSEPGEAFELGAGVAKALHRICDQSGIKTVWQFVPERESSLSAACNGLFDGKIPELTDGRLQVAHCETIYDEVMVAAEGILEIVMSGARFRDTAVVCADMATYGDVIDLVFRRYGIPIYGAGKDEVLRKNVIQSVLDAIEAATSGFEQAAMIRYLKSSLSPVAEDAVDLMEDYALTWAVRGESWNEPWQYRSQAGKKAPGKMELRQLATMEEGRELLMKELAPLRAGLRSGKTCKERIDAIIAFLDGIGFEDRLDELATRHFSQDLRSVQILQQLGEILRGALDQFQAVLGEYKWSIESFVRLLSLLLKQYEVGTIPPVLDAVTIGSMESMRNLTCKYLFVLGANEGAFPSYGSGSGLLSEQERLMLQKWDILPMKDPLDSMRMEYADIYSVLRGAEHQIFVMSSGAQPSYLYRRLAAMAGGAKEVKPYCGAALTDETEIAARLVANRDRETALELGISETYDDVLRRAQYTWGSVSPEGIGSLYGNHRTMSASQVDTLAECRMSYFLKYGLGAKERREVGEDPAEFGIFVHEVLEKTAKEVMERGGFHQVSLEETLEIAAKYADEYAQRQGVDSYTERLAYLFGRNQEELNWIVSELWEELKESRFCPAAFELRFGEGGQLDAIEIPGDGAWASLAGFVDRVDIWHEDGRNYFRVVDYKTGKKDFDYCDIFNGVGLQMLLYLFALEDNQYGKGTGVQYFPARVPLLSADGDLSEDQLAQMRRKEWKRKGLLLAETDILDAMDPQSWQRLNVKQNSDGVLSGDVADREQFGMLRQYVFATLRKLVNDVSSGNVEPNPYTRGSSHDACRFCPYGSICHKESVEGRRNYKTMTAARFWQDVEKEVGNHGG